METNKNVKVVSTIYGEEIISMRDKKVAGHVAIEEGNKFEDYVEELLLENLTSSYGIINQPLYTNWFGMPKLHKDFKLIPKSNFLKGNEDSRKTYMLEAKQLGLVVNNIQKIEYEWANLRHGCYGKDFWLIYDFYRDDLNADRWISNFMENGLPLLLEEMNEKGINLKWIDINDFVKCLTEENLCRKLN